MYQFGFLGCGNMGGALAAAVAKSGASLAIAEKDPQLRQKKAELLSCPAVSGRELAKNSRFLVLGVKPQVLEAALGELRDILMERADDFCIISMAAGVSIDTVCTLVGKSCPVIRIMPNTPAEIGQGMILYAHNALVTPEELAQFASGFAPAGLLEPLAESLIDAGSAISGCGPAFAYLFLEALADGGVKCGLPRQKALRFAAKTLMGSGAMVLETGRHPGVLKDAVCSPGGSTIEGVMALEQAGLRSAAMEAVAAAYEKTLQLGKK